ncbi:MAG: class I SAM-dependent methyltransferase [Promethearchaeota archaeon]
MSPLRGKKILDLGSEDGAYIFSFLSDNKNVILADVSFDLLRIARKRYNYNCVLIPHEGNLPFRTKSIDVIHCSSVIEHVSGNKKGVIKNGNWKFFRETSYKAQKKFAYEINRISNEYFVQTPNKYFLLESHTLIPFGNFIPRILLLKIFHLLNKFWIKKTGFDWSLLSINELELLFPEAYIIKEKFLFLTKSLIAVKNKDYRTR